MTERSPNIELTTFCKNFGRDQKVWSDAIGSEVTSADGRFKILKIMQSSTGTVEGVWISSLSGDEYFTINNLQAKFRSITLTERLYLKLFKPEEYKKIIQEEIKKRQEEERVRIREEERRRREEIHLNKINEQFKSNFFTSEKYYNENLSNYLSIESYNGARTSFVQEWIEKETKARIDPQQADAISNVQNNTIVTARAGSGKTSTLVNKVIFLNQHCGILQKNSSFWHSIEMR